MWCWKRMEKIKWPEKVTNEQVLERVGEKRTLLNNILRRKANWTASFMIPLTEVKGVGRRKAQLLDYLRNRRRYRELKEEAEDRKKMETTVISISPVTC